MDEVLDLYCVFVVSILSFAFLGAKPSLGSYELSNSNGLVGKTETFDRISAFCCAKIT